MYAHGNALFYNFPFYGFVLSLFATLSEFYVTDSCIQSFFANGLVDLKLPIKWNLFGFKIGSVLKKAAVKYFYRQNF